MDEVVADIVLVRAALSLYVASVSLCGELVIGSLCIVRDDDDDGDGGGGR